MANSADRGASRRRLNRLAYFLDSSVPLPGGYRIGLDGIIGLIPGVGDVAGAVLSSYILGEAARMGASKSVLLRMGFNIAVETLVGAVPVFGDIFDMAWKANERNVRLLNAYMDEPRRTSTDSNLVAGGIIALLIGLLVLVAALAILIARWVWRAATTA